ncbi:hypothetical protein HMPREF9120_00265 [Neisseria sp. oral taxon 020 str. F0370]|nr:hypothetical protein HMPREF9120_00265 [Neisseria sp. oral taxon 020 str. F0370]
MPRGGLLRADFFPVRAAYFLFLTAAGGQDGVLFGTVLVVAHIARVGTVLIGDACSGGVFLAQRGAAFAVLVGFPRAGGQGGEEGEGEQVTHGFSFLKNRILADLAGERQPQKGRLKAGAAGGTCFQTAS